ncbi:outer membrane protein [Chondrinema litorale]|uniref:outer membrane protein n=1 Tax=Chondrinema litorale TaxID=2994555 RepID=UPI002542D9C4|nr:outer membrane beta-barrel protein [Chondrinema litorale]UZR94920.1 outer membrane beta-barrel protein [Chondrinema litorale]
MHQLKNIIALLLLISGFQSYGQTELTEKDKNIIQYDATIFINELEVLLNTLSSPTLSRFERDEIIKNSFSGSVNQIFQNAQVVIEDDINPENLYKTKEQDLAVERYLKDLDLFYSKSDSATIHFSNAMASPVKQKAYIYVEVYFKSRFTGSHTISSKPYKTTERVATIIATKKSDSWEMKIASIVYYNAKEHPFVEEARAEVLKKKEDENAKTNEENNSIKVIPTITVNEDAEKNNSLSNVQVAPFLGVASNIGLTIGAKGRYMFLENLGVQAGLNYFLPTKDDHANNISSEESGWELELNGVYTFNTTLPINFYAFAGLNLMRNRASFSFTEANTEETTTSIPDDKRSTSFGLNLGGGVDYPITEKIIPFAELKYFLGDQSVIGIGLRIKLD